MIGDLRELFLSPTASIRDAIACVDRLGKGIALVVDEQTRLVGTITDGDVRRAILSGIDLDRSVSVLLEAKASSAYPAPVTALPGTSDDDLLALMNRFALRHVPIVEANGRVRDLVLLSDLVHAGRLPLTAVVMAGGYGTRLRPLTNDVPKSMLPVGGRPVLEHIIEQLQRAGIHRVNLATHHLSEVIAQHFGDGREFNMDIQYVNEDQPLGTAGALSLLDEPGEPLLVINGDVMTRVDYAAMLQFHREHRAEMTVAVRAHEIHVPYGVVETDGATVRGISEKPVLKHFINAGIYLLNPEVRRLIPNGQPCDMPALISRLVAESRRVICFPVHEYWLDIGKSDDYRQAVADGERHNG